MKLQQLIKRCITIDFETEPIEDRPDYPPIPVGVVVRWPNRKTKSKYLIGDAMKREVKRACASKLPLLFHNAPFDTEVAVVHCGAERPLPSRVHDTLPMLFLLDPHAETFGLKPSSERYLKMKPDERDAVIEWLVEHQPLKSKERFDELGCKLSYEPKWGTKLTDNPRSKGKSTEYAGKYICLAPVTLVGPYCVGDVARTFRLGYKVAGMVERRGMRAAYDQEMTMQPIVTGMEREGVPVNTRKLAADAKLYTTELERLDAWLLKRLRIPKKQQAEFNIDSPQQLGKALVKARLADASKMGLTEGGDLCCNKDALKAGIKNKQVYAALRWRGAVGTCLKTFVRPWLKQAKANGGRVYTRWNSIRRDHAKGGGTRTGRFSSSPNLQNVPKVFVALFLEHELDKLRSLTLPKVPIKGLPNVPSVRSYVVPEKDHVLLDRDFSSQELRVLAYFEDDDIAAAFEKNPGLDLHQKVANDLAIPRYKAKTVNFAILYGVGNGHLAEMLDCSVKEAKKIKADYFKAYPSVKELIDELKKLAALDKPIITWGGRQYYCEPPKWFKGRPWTFEYKLLNYLIQGSSADLTKATLIELKRRLPWLRILATVHDEFLVSAPKKQADRVMRIMREVMAMNLLHNIPMQSTGKRGHNWAAMKECA